MSAVKNNLPRVSVCVPTYNGAEFLRECLTSISAQTFDDFEVVIVDDNSTDNTLEIAREFVGKDERFTIHSNPNRLGLVKNFNRCVHFARGEWIKFLLQDDTLMPQCLERMLATADANGASFLACRREFIFEAGITPETRQFYARSAAGIDRFHAKYKTPTPEEFGRAIIECVGTNLVGEPTSVLLRRELFKRFGGFNEQLVMCCDSEFWYRAGTHDPLIFMPENLASFRVHGSSTSALYLGRNRFLMDHLEPLIVVHEFNHAPIYAALREIVRRNFGSRHLEYLLRDRSWQTWSVLQQKIATKTLDARDCETEWENACQLYPKLRELARPPEFPQKIWALKRAGSPRRLAGRILRKAGLRQ